MEENRDMMVHYINRNITLAEREKILGVGVNTIQSPNTGQ